MHIVVMLIPTNGFDSCKALISDFIFQVADELVADIINDDNYFHMLTVLESENQTEIIILSLSFWQCLLGMSWAVMLGNV